MFPDTGEPLHPHPMPGPWQAHTTFLCSECPSKQQTWLAQQMTTTALHQGNAQASRVSPVPQAGSGPRFLSAAALHQPRHFQRCSHTCPRFQGSTELYGSPVGFSKWLYTESPSPSPQKQRCWALSEKGPDALADGGLSLAPPLSQAVCPPLGTLLLFSSFLCPANTRVGLLLFPFPALHLNAPEAKSVVPTWIHGLNTRPGTHAKGKIPASFSTLSGVSRWWECVTHPRQLGGQRQPLEGRGRLGKGFRALRRWKLGWAEGQRAELQKQESSLGEGPYSTTCPVNCVTKALP